VNGGGESSPIARARRDAAERIEVEYEPLPHVIDPEKALAPGAPLVHPAHGSNVLYHRKFIWGPVEEAFADAEHRIAFRAAWAQRHRGRSKPSASQRSGRRLGNPRHLGLDPDAQVPRPGRSRAAPARQRGCACTTTSTSGAATE